MSLQINSIVAKQQQRNGKNLPTNRVSKQNINFRGAIFVGKPEHSSALVLGLYRGLFSGTDTVFDSLYAFQNTIMKSLGAKNRKIFQRDLQKKVRTIIKKGTDIADIKLYPDESELGVLRNMRNNSDNYRKIKTNYWKKSPTKDLGEFNDEAQKTLLDFALNVINGNGANVIKSDVSTKAYETLKNIQRTYTEGIKGILESLGLSTFEPPIK